MVLGFGSKWPRNVEEFLEKAKRDSQQSIVFEQEVSQEDRSYLLGSNNFLVSTSLFLSYDNGSRKICVETFKYGSTYCSAFWSVNLAEWQLDRGTYLSFADKVNYRKSKIEKMVNEKGFTPLDFDKVNKNWKFLYEFFSREQQPVTISEN